MKKNNDYKNYIEEGTIINKKIEHLKTMEEKVAWLLMRYSKLRNSDKLLVFYYWTHVDKIDFCYIEDKMIEQTTPSESITRARRKIQNDYGLLLPTKKEIITMRKISDKKVKKWKNNKLNKGDK